MHEERLAMSYENNKIMGHQKSHLFNCFLFKLQMLIIKTSFAKKLHRWIWEFCSHIDMCMVHLNFLRRMNLQFSTIAVRMHCFKFYMRICACFDSCSIHVYRCRFRRLLVIKLTFKRNLICFVCVAA